MARANQGLEPQAAFQYTVRPSDNLKVQIEVFAEAADGETPRPQLFNRENLKAYREQLQTQQAQTEAQLEEVSEGSTEHKRLLEQKAAWAMGLEEIDALLERETTLLTAIFRRPSWNLEGVIQQDSYVQQDGRYVWSAEAHEAARLRHLLVDWDLGEPDPQGTGSVVKVPVTRAGDVDPNIVRGFLNAMDLALAGQRPALQDDLKNSKRR